MNQAASILAIFFALTLPSFAGIADQDAVFARLPPGQAVLAGNAMQALAGSLGKGSRFGKFEWVEVTDAPGFAKALRMTTTERPSNPWGLQCSARSTQAVRKGDMLLAVFYARAVQPDKDGTAQSVLVFELDREPYSKLGNFSFEVSRTWSKFYVPMESKGNYSAGETMIHFQAGFEAQTIEIGGLELWNYGQHLQWRELPYTPLTYQGREADAAWRKDAAAMIDQTRKAQLKVVVHDGGGKVISGAKVAVRMQKHAYGFGSAVSGKELFKDGPDADMYRNVIVRSFNKAVIENDLKWSNYERDPKLAHDAVQWLRAAGLAVRGHCLLWPGWKNLPKDLAGLPPEAMRKRILEHVRAEVGAFKGQLAEWDVVNEPFTNNDVQKILGESILADVFKLAHEIDPDAQLFINDYGILSNGGTGKEHQDHYFNTIRMLLNAGAPLHGIGMQGHFGEVLTPPARLWRVLDQFATLGLPIQVTEWDVNVWEEDAQADYTRDFMTAFFAHPATVGIVTWGFWEDRHWIPNAAGWRKDWQLRPAGQVWYDMVFDQWWTNADLITDHAGAGEVRGFLGDYSIEVEAEGKIVSKKVSLARGGSRVEIAL